MKWNEVEWDGMGRGGVGEVEWGRVGAVGWGGVGEVEWGGEDG